MDVFEGLNPQQRAAVEAVRGPVCILAGAGSGKTTTITRRIANQVLTGAFAPSEILAVTFTDKAAGEMRARLKRLGVDGVQARTFHSAALAQLRFFLGRRLGEILPSKAMTLQPIRRSLPVPYKFRPLGDLASEIEWAKNRRLTPETYLGGLGGDQPPIPARPMMTLVPKLGGSEKVLRATRESGPGPVLRACESAETEVASIVERIKELGPPYEEIAVLYRINARSEEFEGALSEAGIPYQVRGGAFLARPAARGMFRALRGATHLVGVAD